MKQSKYQVNITAGILNWEWIGYASDKNHATQQARAWAINNDCIPSDFKLDEPKEQESPYNGYPFVPINLSFI